MSWSSATCRARPVEHALTTETARRSLEAALKQAADRTVAEVGDGRG